MIAGEGEPTMHPRFTDMMRAVSGQSFKTILMSNGTFPGSLCREVLRADRVEINLGAVDRAGYKKLHGRDLFGRVTENIRTLAALRDAEKPGFEVGIEFVINRLNAGLQQKAQALAAGLGVNAFVPKTMTTGEYNLDVLPERTLPDKKEERAALLRPPCFNGWFVMSVELDGSVGLCRRTDSIKVGDIKKGSFRDIWASKEFMRMRLAGRCGDFYKKNEDCRDCPYRQDNISVARTILAINKARRKAP